MVHEKLFGHIPPLNYWNDDVLTHEIESVFSPSWICVAFTDDLKNNNDFVTTQIGNRSIVVQNFKGVIKAFRNLCSHRFSLIQTSSCGNRPLTCPYHGWSYDSNGIPIGIPLNTTQFNLSEKDREKLALNSYDLEICGRFIFIRMKKTGPSLRSFLGRVYDDLEHFSEICCERIATSSTVVNVNWKIGLENAAEGYHIPMAHKESLGQTLDKDLSTDYILDHSVFYRSLSKESLNWWQHISKLLSMKPSALFPQSTNYVIFPNSVILATFGASFVFQTYEPLKGNQYCLKSTYWIAKNNCSQTSKYVVDTLTAYSDRIISEDKAICESVQLGVQDASVRPAILGGLENRVAHFQSAYDKYMNPNTYE